MRTISSTVLVALAGGLVVLAAGGCAEKGSGCDAIENKDAPGSAQGYADAVVKTAEKNAERVAGITQMQFDGDKLPTRANFIEKIDFVVSRGGTVKGSIKNDISEPSGEQTRKGTESFDFTGTYDEKTGKLTGTFTLDIHYIDSGGGMPQVLEHTYSCSGVIEMKKNKNGVLEGTAGADYELSEVYSGGDSNAPPRKEAGDATWLATALFQ